MPSNGGIDHPGRIEIQFSSLDPQAAASPPSSAAAAAAAASPQHVPPAACGTVAARCAGAFRRGKGSAARPSESLLSRWLECAPSAGQLLNPG